MTIAVRPPSKASHYTYVDGAEKTRRDAAIKIAAAANSDTKLLTTSQEERERLAAEAARLAALGATKLSPEQVRRDSMMKVDYMSAEGGYALLQILPEALARRTNVVAAKDRKIVSIPEAPHSALSLMAVIDAGRGRQIGIYSSNNLQGTVSVKDGVPRLVGIKHADEKTQNDPRYFGISIQRLPDGKRQVSEQILFDNKDINDVAARCCQLFGLPAPAERYTYRKDQKAAEKSKLEQSSVSSAKPSRFANTSGRTMTILEQRIANAAAQRQSQQVEHSPPAYGMR